MATVLVGAALLLTLVCFMVTGTAIGAWADDKQLTARFEKDGPLLPEERRHLHELLFLTVGMSMAAVIAGALAGIGGALFVRDGMLHWSERRGGIELIGIGVILVTVFGFWSAYRVTRPWHQWADDGEALSEHLRQASTKPGFGQQDLVIYKKRLRDLRQQQLFGRRTRLLARLGLIEPLAAREWRSARESGWRDRLRRRFTLKHVLRFALVSGESRTYEICGGLAVLCLLLAVPFSDQPGSMAIVAGLLLAALVVCWPMTIIPAKGRLVLENRVLARRRVGLVECARRIKELEAALERPEAPRDRVLVQIGSWALVRRRPSDR